MSCGQTKIILFDWFFQPTAQIFTSKCVEQFPFSHLIISCSLLCFAIITGDRTWNAQIWQFSDQICISSKEYLLCQTRYLVVYRFTGQWIHHFNRSLADWPIYTEIWRFDLISRFGWCDQCKFRLVQEIWRRKTLNGCFDPTAYSATKTKTKSMCYFEFAINQCSSNFLTDTCDLDAKGCPKLPNTSKLAEWLMRVRLPAHQLHSIEQFYPSMTLSTDVDLASPNNNNNKNHHQ